MNRQQVLFCTLMLLFSPYGIAQSFFYIEANVGGEKMVAATYYLLLNVEPDGNATARIRYIKTQTGEKLFVEQRFTEYADTAAILTGNDNLKHLVPSGAALFLGDIEDHEFLQIRIVCTKKADSLGTFYEPSAVEYKGNSNQWYTAETKTIQQKNLDDLVRNKSFAEIFYPPGDVMHSYIFDFKTRALNAKELKTTFHFIAVANTNDFKIGTSCKKDLAKVTTLLQTMTDQLGIRFLPTTIFGDAFNKKNLDNLIDTFAPAPTDIVMFYYTGHGFRYPNDKSDFARVSMRTNTLQTTNENNLGLEDIYNRLLKKKARFTLVLSDCCNQLIDAPIPLGLALLRTRSTGPPPRLNVENWKALFLPNSPSSILIGAAEKNQLAVCNPTLGGFYTNFFVAELEKSLFTNNTNLPTWWGILNAAREKTRWQSLSAVCSNNPKTRCVQLATMKVVLSR